MNKISTSSAGLGCGAVLIFLSVLWLVVVMVVGFLWICALLVKEQRDKVRSGGTSARRSTTEQVTFGVLALAVLLAIGFTTYSLVTGDVFSLMGDGAPEP
ncbi:MAG: hypothetical protein OXF79_20890 [Chloroflexi bacterium]|nr:hypothetical protein [Chloroflexota bacterium]